jgi:hypothetical protein
VNLEGDERRMNAIRPLAALLVCLCALSAEARAETPADCPIPPLATSLRYEHLHQIPTTPGADDVTHKVVTPGGMVLDTPNMVAATDVLTMFALDQSVMCFGLLTFARERNRCDISGVAHKEADGTFLYRDGNVVVRFTFPAEDQIKVEPIATGYRDQCEPSGEIQLATYARSPRAH